MKTHRDLEVWQKSREFVTTVYTLTKDFPKDEIYGLTNQIRQSAVLIPSNIAEGSARRKNKEYRQFLYIALGSLAELETQLIIAHDLKYIESIAEYDSSIANLRMMLESLIKSLKDKKVD
ncbi:four helix bundle protein [Myroides marinus]|uniref:four helix bundle protein n=1 Tax=Myroides TaxID=76831 RepID=UPI0025751649|nr:four helix bundle protein [Myroides marinus]MDM1346131.1 four helix bundle protein [Myroides marinus]MDM1351119.1 four helix bundle protein [Myroides marinus]MDM1353385.1 four helix bundle protein [Myroides marinus]MDM1358365.1 four helix bundle protein [Myroides marinus]MDM1364011.1 four helix bundle protein [Myroides marinus]